MLDDLIGKRSITQFRKISNGIIVIVVNYTKGSQQLVQKIRQGDTALQLSIWLTAEVSFPRILKRYPSTGSKLIHIAMKLRPSSKVTPKKSLNITPAARIVGRSKLPSTVVTCENQEMPATVHCDEKPQTPELYIPSVLQCSRCQKCWHTRANFHSDVTCHYCSGPRTYNEGTES